MLGKHFYRRASLEYDFERFAFEHVGISLSSTLAEVTRLLSNPLLELKSIGLIKPLTKEARFVKVAKGQWKVIFDRGGSETRVVMSEAQVDVYEQLKGRGVTATKALKHGRGYEPKRIAEKKLWLKGESRHKKIFRI